MSAGKAHGEGAASRLLPRPSQLPPQPLLGKAFFRFNYAAEVFSVKQERKSNSVHSLFSNPGGRFARLWFCPREAKCEFNSTARIMQRLSKLCSSERDGSKGPDFHLPPGVQVQKGLSRLAHKYAD